ncbi:MAG: hypothetical protein FWH55_02590 [Oscillospiraceae bacterium]|nr:hypothetical protein [Oscillospiraceae bacterium]
MQFSVPTFTKTRPLAEHIKQIMACYGSRISPLGDGVIFSWENLVQYLGQFLDIEANRALFIKSNAVAGTVKSVLLKDQYTSCIKALKEYSIEIYGSLEENKTV